MGEEGGEGASGVSKEEERPWVRNHRPQSKKKKRAVPLPCGAVEALVRPVPTPSAQVAA